MKMRPEGLGPAGFKTALIKDIIVDVWVNLTQGVPRGLNEEMFEHTNESCIWIELILLVILFNN